MEDRIPGWLQHHHETCCEKGGHCGRQACMIIPQRCNFQMGGLAYDSIPSLGLSLRSPISFTQKPHVL